MIEQSVTIAELAKALATAQGQIRPAIKDSTNPHFRSKYADLGAVWEACRDAPMTEYIEAPAAPEPYTRLPNFILEAMPSLRESTLRVVLAIARQTVGWGKPADVISVSQFSKATGMGRQGVQNGIETAIEQGFIHREPAKRGGFSYRLLSEHEHAQLFHKVERSDYSTKETIPLCGTEPFHKVERSSPQPFHLVETQKKDLKEKKERSTRTANAAARAPKKSKQEPASPIEIREALAEACSIDLEAGLKEDVLQVNQTAAAIWKSQQERGFNLDQTLYGIRQTASYAKRTQYPYNQGQRLNPSAIRKFWKLASEEAKKNAPIVQAPEAERPPVVSGATMRAALEAAGLRIRGGQS